LAEVSQIAIAVIEGGGHTQEALLVADKWFVGQMTNPQESELYRWVAKEYCRLLRKQIERLKESNGTDNTERVEP